MRRICYARPAIRMPAPDGRDWPDNAQRFARARRGRGGRSAAAVLPAFVPDVVHAHDWQAGLAPAYLHYGGGAAARAP